MELKELLASWESSVRIYASDVQKYGRDLGFALDEETAQRILFKIRTRLYDVSRNALENFIKGILLTENTRGKDSESSANGPGNPPAAGRHVPEEANLQGPTEE